MRGVENVDTRWRCSRAEEMDHQEIGSYVGNCYSHSSIESDLLPRSSADVDEDVLADYVIALLRSEASEQQLKVDACSNLEDFLKESK